jgi:outer membrane receptor protein involved in Fe transport
LDDYHDLSTSLEWGRELGTTFSVGLSNLLDEDYQESPGNFHRGISIRAAVSHYF